MAKLQDTEIFGNLAVTGSTTIAGSVLVAGDGNDVLKVGDDCWIKDVDIANAIGIIGVQTPANGVIVFGDGKDTNIYRSAANTLKTDDSFIIAGTQTISGIGASSCAGDFHILGDHELGCVQSVADPEGLVMQIDYTDGNTDSRLFFREASGNLYGGSIIYAADVSPVFDGTTFTNCSVANTLYFLTHSNNATGTVFMSVLRGSTGPTIPGTLTAGGLSVSGSMTLNGAITGVNSIACDLGTSINEFSIDGTMAGDSDNAVPTEKAVKAYVASSGGGPGSGNQYSIPIWTTTTTLGSSLLSQDSGSTILTLNGPKFVIGDGAAEYTYLRHHNSKGTCYAGLAYAINDHVTGSASGDYVISCRTGASIVFSADSAYAQKHMQINEDGDIRCNVNNYFDIKPATDTYGLIIRDSGSDSYYVNIKNVNGDVFIGDTTSTVGSMIKLAGTATTLPGTLAISGALSGATTGAFSSYVTTDYVRVNATPVATTNHITVGNYNSNGLQYRIMAENSYYLEIYPSSLNVGFSTNAAKFNLNKPVYVAGHITLSNSSDLLVETSNVSTIGSSTSSKFLQAWIATVTTGDIIFANKFTLREVRHPDWNGDKDASDKEMWAQSKEDGATPGLEFWNNKGEMIALLDEDGDFHVRGKIYEYSTIFN
jgi:hypothetical protein